MTQTRVEKINEYIKFLYINKGMSVRQIQAELRPYLIELSLVELLTIVSTFNYKPVKERKKSKIQVAREEFKPLLSSLIKICSDNDITNKKLSEYFKYRGIKHPNRGPLTARKIESLVEDYEIKFPRKTIGGHKEQIKDCENLAAFIEERLTDAELKSLENWVQTHVK